MSRYWSSFPSYSQPSVEELRMRAASSVSSAKKKGQHMEPAVPQSQRGPICQSWWGQAWCENLERYADYATRLGRGQRYIRIGTVVDLKISKGRIEARVQGSRRAPYKIEIRISPLSEEKCQFILEKCGKRIQTMEDLVYGKFPEELKELFTQKNGLFPSPAEISFMCSCPDWALMCKHVAAAMYGVGLRLDENPFYFFELRGIDVDRFINVALESKVESMLDHASARTSRMMDNDSIPGLFGVTGPEHFITPVSVSSDDSGLPDAPVEQETCSARDDFGTPTISDVQESEITSCHDSIPDPVSREMIPENEFPVQSAAGPDTDPSPLSSVQPGLPRFFIQSQSGGEISQEELIRRIHSVCPDADHIYVKPGENRAYWTCGERNGFLELW